MFSVYDLEPMYKSHIEKDGEENLSYRFVKEGDNPDNWYIEYKSDGLKVPAREFVQYIRKEIGQDFECIWSCHGTLQSTLRCRKCGTVIFSSDDCYNAEENLCCPTCTNYETHFEFWTAEEIEADEKKKNTIAFLEEQTKLENEAYERRKKRNGKYDWQLGSIKINFKKHYLRIDFECDSIMNKFKLKGLRADVHFINRETYVSDKSFCIPLSYSHAKLLIRIKIKRYKNKKAGKPEWEM